ncbi:unnamed protein product [Orchesella dallaii]|uniref:Uncharacterized protein n=1 Tax=Orchesella dallaii TaxID=48710 RepID=A0ABP1RHT7_9HEXA
MPGNFGFKMNNPFNPVGAHQISPWVTNPPPNTQRYFANPHQPPQNVFQPPQNTSQIHTHNTLHQNRCPLPNLSASPQYLEHKSTVTREEYNKLVLINKKLSALNKDQTKEIAVLKSLLEQKEPLEESEKGIKIFESNRKLREYNERLIKSRDFEIALREEAERRCRCGILSLTSWQEVEKVPLRQDDRDFRRKLLQHNLDSERESERKQRRDLVSTNKSYLKQIDQFKKDNWRLKNENEVQKQHLDKARSDLKAETELRSNAQEELTKTVTNVVEKLGPTIEELQNKQDKLQKELVSEKEQHMLELQAEKERADDAVHQTEEQEQVIKDLKSKIQILEAANEQDRKKVMTRRSSTI